MSYQYNTGLIAIHPRLVSQLTELGTVNSITVCHNLHTIMIIEPSEARDAHHNQPHDTIHRDKKHGDAL